MTEVFLWDVLLPNPPLVLLRLAERNFVLLILLRDFFEVERNLFDVTLLPPTVFAEVVEGGGWERAEEKTWDKGMEEASFHI